MFWSGSLRRFADRCERSARSAGNGCNFMVWRLLGGAYRLERIGTGATREGAPASVSAPVHELLRCGLGFTGWIMADNPARPNSPVRRGSAYFQAESEKTHGQSSPLRRVRLHPGQNGVVNVLKSVVRMKLFPALTASACERDPLNAARVPCGVSERMGRAVYSHICADLMKNAEIL